MNSVVCTRIDFYRKIFIAVLALLVVRHLARAQVTAVPAPSTNLTDTPITARAAADKAATLDTVTDSITYLSTVIASMATPAEKRALYYFLGGLQEQAGFYDDASKSYAAAAGIGASSASGIQKRSSEQLVLDAVRCALSAGDFHTADLYLNSQVRNSEDIYVQSYVRLYDVWSKLCRAETTSSLEEPLALLRTYATLSTMETVRPQIFFTLWYLTGENTWASSLRNKYPSSLETGIVNGTVRLLPAPFWYFVPHSEITSSDNDSSVISVAGNINETNAGASASSTESSPASEKVRLQLGLFREKANADSLVARVTQRGFKPYIITEKRESGTTYYIVLVDDTDGRVATKLRSAGFECYRY